MYAPDQGRWVSRDSYRGNVNDPLSLHGYAYCNNDPVNAIDPSGFLSLSTQVFYTGQTTMLTYSEEGDGFLGCNTRTVKINDLNQAASEETTIRKQDYGNKGLGKVILGGISWGLSAILGPTVYAGIENFFGLDLSLNNPEFDPSGNPLAVQIGDTITYQTRGYISDGYSFWETEVTITNSDGEVTYNNVYFESYVTD